MQVQGETRGLILLGEKLTREGFTPADLEFLSSLGNLAMIALENTRLFREAIEKQKLEDELVIAREIQKGLLPSLLPSIPGFSIAAANISSKQVGGDYYDAIPLSETDWVIAIGDVSGKGTPAALLMANLQATIRALVPLGFPLAELTGKVNDLLCENTGGSKFVTFFWGIMDSHGRTLRYVNAGHNYPILFRRDGSMKMLDKGGMILGVLKTTLPYEQETVALRSGDVLVMYTDGISEAMNRAGQEYGEERLEQVVRSQQDSTADQILKEIYDDVVTHAGGAPQSDDITMMVLKVE
jgi:sigma-B regulation protein RsbU (phosphoserine phosphatase)